MSPSIHIDGMSIRTMCRQKKGTMPPRVGRAADLVQRWVMVALIARQELLQAVLKRKWQSMIRVSFFLTRRRGSTHEEFHQYWTEKHTALLCTPVESMPNVHRYVRLFPTPADVTGFHMAYYDGVAEI